MHDQLRVTFHGMDPSPTVVRRIREKAAKLEDHARKMRPS